MSEQTPPPADPATDTPPAPTPAPPKGVTPEAFDKGTPPAPAEWDGKVESLPEPVQKMIRDLRTESADKRTKLTAAEQAQRDALAALARAAGIELPGVEGDKAPDAAELATQLAASQQAARQAAVELAVYKAAPAHQGDAAALLDSRSFLEKVANLDPKAEGFTTDVDAAVKAAVNDNPKLKVARVASASGVDHPGGSGESTSPASRALPGQPRLAAAYAANPPG